MSSRARRLRGRPPSRPCRPFGWRAPPAGPTICNFSSLVCLSPAILRAPHPENLLLLSCENLLCMHAHAPPMNERPLVAFPPFPLCPPLALCVLPTPALHSSSTITAVVLCLGTPAAVKAVQAWCVLTRCGGVRVLGRQCLPSFFPGKFQCQDSRKRCVTTVLFLRGAPIEG